MADKSKADSVSQDIRSAAESTLSQAKDAVDGVLKEASRSYDRVDSSVQAAQAGARGINQMIMANAEANLNAAFEFAQELVRANDPREIATLHQDFVKRQTEQLNAQMRDLSATALESVTAAQPKTE